MSNSKPFLDAKVASLDMSCTAIPVALEVALILLASSLAVSVNSVNVGKVFELTKDCHKLFTRSCSEPMSLSRSGIAEAMSATSWSSTTKSSVKLLTTPSCFPSSCWALVNSCVATDALLSSWVVFWIASNLACELTVIVVFRSIFTILL